LVRQKVQENLYAPNTKNLFDLGIRIRGGRNDEGSVKKVDRDAVGRALLGTTHEGVSAVASHHNDGCEFVLNRAVEEREALNVEHVNLVNKEHARNNVGLALLTPLGNLGVDLLTDLGLDFARIAFYFFKY